MVCFFVTYVRIKIVDSCSFRSLGRRLPLAPVPFTLNLSFPLYTLSNFFWSFCLFCFRLLSDSFLIFPTFLLLSDDAHDCVRYRLYLHNQRREHRHHHHILSPSVAIEGQAILAKAMLA